MLFSLKALRINAGYTSKEVGELANTHPQTILKYEKDSTKIPMDLLKFLSDLYQVPTDYIFLGKQFELNRKIKEKQEV